MGTVDLFPSFFPKKPLFLNGGRYIVVAKTVGRVLHQCRKRITSYLYIKIRSHFSLKRRMSWKFFPVLLINVSFCPQHSHIFFYFSYNCQKSCNLAIVASVLSGYNCICSFIYNAFRPYQIFFTFCFFYWKIRFPALKIIPEFSHIMFLTLTLNVYFEFQQILSLFFILKSYLGCDTFCCY